MIHLMFLDHIRYMIHTSICTYIQYFLFVYLQNNISLRNNRIRRCFSVALSPITQLSRRGRRPLCLEMCIGFHLYLKIRYI